jgi:CRP/FNR family cyclic AMP-dependent transcriptional regulator
MVQWPVKASLAKERNFSYHLVNQKNDMRTILVIEDNEDIRNNTAEILSLSNYAVIQAENGKLGLEMAIAHKPDLIICDIMMPVLDGYGVLHAVHKNDPIKNTPFIFLTAKTERGDFRKGMELGADDYISKPFSGTELLTAVDSRLKKIDLLKTEFSPGIEGLQQLVAVTGIAALASLTEDRNINKVKKKQIIYHEGNHPNRLYYVVSGKVKNYRSNTAGKELITDLFNTGDFFGYTAMLEKKPYSDTAEALEDTALAVIHKEDFENLLHSNREVAMLFIRLLAKNVSEREHQLLGLAYNSLRKKVADAILLLQNKYATAEDLPFVIDISRENLAMVAGTATESLIRTLSDFRAEGLIELKDGGIRILNKKKLKELIN